MITVANLSKQFAKQTVLKDVSLSIYRNEKIGLTGPNGAGKSTLFNIVLGDVEPSSGGVQIQRNLNIGHLAQEAHFDSKRTVLDELTCGDLRISVLTEERRKLEDDGKADTMRYGDVLYELEQMGIYDLEHKAERILSGLGFKEEDFNKPINQLSGGWQMRTLLAKLLTYPYDILLLDEPTNYLDMDATLWFKEFLTRYKGTFILISHDKVFLNDVTNYTIILEAGQMTKMKGNYEAYEETKEVRYRTLEKQKKVVDKKKKQLERFTQRFHAQPNRASAVRNKRKMIERLENIDLPQEKKSIKDFEFPQTKRSGQNVISLSNVSKSYGDKTIYNNLNFEVTRGQKVCLVGPNGAGKSTLLKILAGVVEPDGGQSKTGHNVDLGYFSQTRLDVLNPQRTVFEECAAAITGGSLPALRIRSLLGLFNFHGDDVFKLVKVLSGGEKSRLILAKLLINPPNCMLLDEPTTHLDIDGVEALTKAFKAYAGTLCFISHDLFFVKEIANHIIEVNGGQLTQYPGGLQYYMDKKAGSETPSSKNKKSSKPGKIIPEGKKLTKKGKLKPVETDLHKRHRAALVRMKEIKKEIKELEKRKKDLETESYIKSRMLTRSFTIREKSSLKEIGQRLKAIPKELRAAETKIKELNEEKRRISR